MIEAVTLVVMKPAVVMPSLLGIMMKTASAAARPMA